MRRSNRLFAFDLVAFATLLTTLLGSCASTGCTATLKGGGKVGILYQTDTFIGFQHQAEEGNTSESSSKLESQPIEDYLNGSDEPTPEPTPEN